MTGAGARRAETLKKLDLTGNAVTFASTTPLVCTVSGSTATIVSAGTCSLTADQAGNGNYEAAPQVTASVVIKVPVYDAANRIER